MRAYYVAYQLVVSHSMQDRTMLQEPEGTSYWNHSLWRQAIKRNSQKCVFVITLDTE